MNRLATIRSLSALRAAGLRSRWRPPVVRPAAARTFATAHSSPPPDPAHNLSPEPHAPFVPSSSLEDENAAPSLADAARPPVDSAATVHAADPAFVDTATPPLATDAPTLNSATASADAVSNTAATSTVAADAAAVATDAAAAATDAAAAGADAAAAAAAATPFADSLLTPAYWLLTHMHDWTGLPWWASIALSTIAIRTLLLPVTLLTMKNSALMGALKDDIAERRESVMSAMRSGDRSLATLRQGQMQTFMREAGVAPMRVLVGPLAQFPVFISFFVGIRRMSASDPTFTTGGLAWFENLAVMDSSYVLPIIAAGSLFLMTEFGGDSGNKMTPQMKMGMRAVAGLSVPMTYWFPAAVFCYWIPNNLFSASLGAATRSAPGKRLLGLNIDLAKIPGTRAYQRQAAKRAGFSQTVASEAIDPALAAASYMKNKPVPSADTVKPVLLKTRPKKKSARTK